MSLIEVEDYLVEREDYEEKYLKYKTKYITLKEQQGQGLTCPTWTYFYCFEENYNGLPGTPAGQSDFKDRTAFKKLVSYRAYELTSSGALLSYLTLSYTSKVFGTSAESAVAKELYQNMFQVSNLTGKESSWVNTKNIDSTTSSIGNLNIVGDLAIIDYLNYSKTNFVYKKTERGPVLIKRIVVFYNDMLVNIYNVTYSDQLVKEDKSIHKAKEITPNVVDYEKFGGGNITRLLSKILKRTSS
jgi:hypothetical protein